MSAFHIYCSDVHQAACGMAAQVIWVTDQASPPTGASARLEGVSKPELLPKQYTPVIDVAGFLTEGEVSKFPGTTLSISAVAASAS